MRRLIGLLCLSLVPVPSVLAQGLFTDRGFGVEAGWARVTSDDLYGVGVGYAFGPLVEVGVAYSWFADRGDSRVNVMSVGPSVGVYPIRKGPVKVRLGVSIDHDSYRPDFGGDRHTGSTIGGTATLYRPSPRGRRVGVTPALTAGYYSSSVEVWGVRDSERSGQFDLALHVALRKGNSIVLVSPVIAVNTDGDTAAGISLSSVWGRR